MKELPLYQSHKKVHALKIARVKYISGDFTDASYGAYLVPEDSNYCEILVNPGWLAKHEPKGPGYFVIYEDGYKSWSPVEAFEEGYTLC